MTKTFTVDVSFDAEVWTRVLEATFSSEFQFELLRDQSDERVNIISRENLALLSIVKLVLRFLFC